MYFLFIKRNNADFGVYQEPTYIEQFIHEGGSYTATSGTTKYLAAGLLMTQNNPFSRASGVGGGVGGDGLSELFSSVRWVCDMECTQMDIIVGTGITVHSASTRDAYTITHGYRQGSYKSRNWDSLASPATSKDLVEFWDGR